jgi:hypothetical protein
MNTVPPMPQSFAALAEAIRLNLTTATLVDRSFGRLVCAQTHPAPEQQFSPGDSLVATALLPVVASEFLGFLGH